MTQKETERQENQATNPLGRAQPLGCMLNPWTQFTSWLLQETKCSLFPDHPSTYLGARCSEQSDFRCRKKHWFHLSDVKLPLPGTTFYSPTWGVSCSCHRPQFMCFISGFRCPRLAQQWNSLSQRSSGSGLAYERWEIS